MSPTAPLTLLALLLSGPSLGATQAEPNRSRSEAPAGNASRWTWPVSSRLILRGFEEPTGPYGVGHRGIDLDALAGEPVLAAAEGEVAFAGTVAGRGVLAIVHPGGFRSSIEPVRANVAAGTSVRAGDVVGFVEGHSHCSESCVHFGVRRDGHYVPPEFLLEDPPRPVLLPL